MTIEDVDFLKKNGKKQNYTFLIDSNNRDKLKYSEPNNYVVNFDTPFLNVIGFEIIEASVPRTLYNVDTSNNMISFFIYDSTFNINNISNYYYKQCYIDPGDYTIQTLIPMLNSVLYMNLNNNLSSNQANIIVSTLSNPPDTTNLLQFYSAYSFIIDMKNSTIAETLGFSTFMQLSETNKIIDINNLDKSMYYFNNNNNTITKRYDTILYPKNNYNTSNNYQLYHSVDDETITFPESTNDIFTGPRGVVNTLPLGGSYVSQSFSNLYNAKFNKIQIAASSSTGILSVNQQINWSLYSGLPPFNNTRLLGSNVINIDYTDGAYSTSQFNSINLDIGLYSIVFSENSPDPKNISKIYYNDYPIRETSLISSYQLCTSSTSNFSSSNIIDKNNIHFEASLILTTELNYHRLIAPGVFTLIGEKYMLLRCPEIEQNSYRSLAYSQNLCMGLAKFRLGVTGYSENQLDYKVPFREFHPIGKLSKLTLSFQKQDGSLYDFKGINHTIVAAIYYYEVLQKQEFKNSILNPNYMPDVVNYLYKQEEQDIDSDDQEFDYNRDHPDTSFKINESFHMPVNIARRDGNALLKLNIDTDDESE
jgi:hypothetical protein